jgi:CRISPR system Cascade subunit CasC
LYFDHRSFNIKPQEVEKMFVELHVIQNFAPSNLNRDDTGNPKDAEFGGVRRARVSSQSFKRAIRKAPVFAKTTGVDLGTRTRWVTRLLRQSLEAQDKPSEEIQAALANFIPKYLSKFDGKFKPDEDAPDKNRTAVLLYIGSEELQAITQALMENWEALVEGDEKVARSASRKLVKEHQDVTGAPDIALFGRMLAEKPELNLEAACQVAHAISTHRVTMEMDFFTAVDDMTQGTEETGAGMMGFTGFNSACFYRYVRMDWEQLVNNLGGDVDLARTTVEAFLRAVVEAVPSGKQNAFAAHNPPSFMLAAVRDGSFAWSLANAFESPVRPQNEGLVGPSVAALDAYWDRLCHVYGTGSLKAVAALPLDPGLKLKALDDAATGTLEEWIERALEALPSREA